MPKLAMSPGTADPGAALEVIARVLRCGALADPVEDLASWVAGVEVIEGLRRAGLTVVRSASVPSAVPPPARAAAVVLP